MVGDAFAEEMPPWHGMHVGPPYLGAALICQTVFEDAPGLTDVLHIHATTLIAVSPGQEKTTIATEGGHLFLWLRMYAADAPGDYELDVRFLSPSGLRLARWGDGCSEAAPHSNKNRRGDAMTKKHRTYVMQIAAMSCVGLFVAQTPAVAGAQLGAPR